MAFYLISELGAVSKGLSCARATAEIQRRFDAYERTALGKMEELLCAKAPLAGVLLEFFKPGRLSDHEFERDLTLFLTRHFKGGKGKSDTNSESEPGARIGPGPGSLLKTPARAPEKRMSLASARRKQRRERERSRRQLAGAREMLACGFIPRHEFDLLLQMHFELGCARRELNEFGRACSRVRASPDGAPAPQPKVPARSRAARRLKFLLGKRAW